MRFSERHDENGYRSQGQTRSTRLDVGCRIGCCQTKDDERDDDQAPTLNRFASGFGKLDFTLLNFSLDGSKLIFYDRDADTLYVYPQDN